MFIKNLKKLLEENNLSVAALARETRIPKSTINSWIQGRSPNLEQLERVASYFNTSIDFLAFNKRDMMFCPLSSIEQRLRPENTKSSFAKFRNENEESFGGG